MPDKDNIGYIFNNADNPKAKAPYGGSATIDGIDWWINAWVNEKDGKKYFKLSFRPKQLREEPRQKSWSEELDDSTPF